MWITNWAVFKIRRWFSSSLLMSLSLQHFHRFTRQKQYLKHTVTVIIKLWIWIRCVKNQRQKYDGNGARELAQGSKIVLAVDDDFFQISCLCHTFSILFLSILTFLSLGGRAKVDRMIEGKKETVHLLNNSWWQGVRQVHWLTTTTTRHLTYSGKK